MPLRFADLAEYVLSTGAHGMLFTCSAFGPCIDAVKRRWPDVSVLKPNEAMIEEAVARGKRMEPPYPTSNRSRSSWQYQNSDSEP